MESHQVIIYFMAGMSMGVGFCMEDSWRGIFLLSLGVIFLTLGG